MAATKKWAYEAFMDGQGIDAEDLPRHLQAAIRLHRQAAEAAGHEQTPELLAQAGEIAEEVEEWFEEEDDDDEPAPAPAPAEVPSVATDPLTDEQVLMQLLGQQKTRVTARELKAAGFRATPGPTGGRYGAYTLSKPQFGDKYTITFKKR